jgi:hypothetical protein
MEMLLYGRETAPQGIVDTTGPRRQTTSLNPPVMAGGTRRSWLPSGSPRLAVTDAPREDETPRPILGRGVLITAQPGAR